MLVSISVDEHRPPSLVSDAVYEPVASAAGAIACLQRVLSDTVWHLARSPSQAMPCCSHLEFWFSTIFISLLIKRRLKDRLVVSQSLGGRGLRADCGSRRLLVDEPANYQFCVTRLTVDVHTPKIQRGYPQDTSAHIRVDVASTPCLLAIPELSACYGRRVCSSTDTGHSFRIFFSTCARSGCRMCASVEMLRGLSLCWLTDS